MIQILKIKKIMKEYSKLGSKFNLDEINIFLKPKISHTKIKLAIKTKKKHTKRRKII